MNPYLQDILHNITTRLAKLEEAQEKKEWVGLTETERIDILDAEITTQSTEHFALAQAIEAKLKEKNER